MNTIQNISVLTLLSSLFVGCGETGLADLESDKKTKAVNNASVISIQAEGLSYLNQIRSSLGMVTFQRNTQLEEAAKNHAFYLTQNNLFSHYESENDAYFTGVLPVNRTTYTRYAHANVGENISSSNASVQNSVDTLFSAIYHRFAFLNFDYDEMGIGFSQSSTYGYDNVYNYNMGMSPLRILCESDGVLRENSYYENICTDKSQKIGVQAYASALNFNKQANPSLVVWPAQGSQQIPPVFFEESPDPLPECSVSGYPMSISFNPLKSGNIMIDSFKLFDNQNREIKAVKLMDKRNDPNGHFSDKEFALFPTNRLDWNADYHVEIAYHDSGVAQSKSVDFKTASLPYPSQTVQNKGVVLTASVNQTTIFYLPPSHCNDVLNTFSATGVPSEIAFYDANTIMITPKSEGKLEVFPSNGRNFTINVR